MSMIAKVEQGEMICVHKDGGLYVRRPDGSTRNLEWEEEKPKPREVWISGDCIPEPHSYCSSRIEGTDPVVRGWCKFREVIDE